MFTEANALPKGLEPVKLEVNEQGQYLIRNNEEYSAVQKEWKRQNGWEDIVKRGSVQNALWGRLRRECHEEKNFNVGLRKAMCDISGLPKASAVEGNKVHLCASCMQETATCSVTEDDVIFGDSVRRENICCCKFYRPYMENHT